MASGPYESVNSFMGINIKGLSDTEIFSTEIHDISKLIRSDTHVCLELTYIFRQCLGNSLNLNRNTIFKENVDLVCILYLNPFI